MSLTHSLHTLSVLLRKIPWDSCPNLSPNLNLHPNQSRDVVPIPLSAEKNLQHAVRCSGTRHRCRDTIDRNHLG